MIDGFDKIRLTALLVGLGIPRKTRTKLVKKILEMDADLTAEGINARYVFKEMKKT